MMKKYDSIHSTVYAAFGSPANVITPNLNSTSTRRSRIGQYHVRTCFCSSSFMFYVNFKPLRTKSYMDIQIMVVFFLSVDQFHPPMYIFFI